MALRNSPARHGREDHTANMMRTFDASFVSLNKLFDEQSSGWWFKTPRRSRDVAVMIYQTMPNPDEDELKLIQDNNVPQTI